MILGLGIVVFIIVFIGLSLVFLKQYVLSIIIVIITETLWIIFIMYKLFI